MGGGGRLDHTYVLAPSGAPDHMGGRGETGPYIHFSPQRGPGPYRGEGGDWTVRTFWPPVGPQTIWGGGGRLDRTCHSVTLCVSLSLSASLWTVRPVHSRERRRERQRDTMRHVRSSTVQCGPMILHWCYNRLPLCMGKHGSARICTGPHEYTVRSSTVQRDAERHRETQRLLGGGLSIYQEDGCCKQGYIMFQFLPTTGRGS